MSRWFNTYGFADVAERLTIGAYPQDAEDVQMLEFLMIDRVLNLAEDAEYKPGVRQEVAAELERAGIEEERLRLPDYGHLPGVVLEAALEIIGDWLDEGRRVYMHCRAGWQRSAAIAAAVIAVREGMSLEDALARVQTRKPSADPLPHQLEDLRVWWEERQNGGAGAGR